MPGVVVTRRPHRPDGRLAHPGPEVGVQGRGRRLLDDLLVPSLDRAFPLEQMDRARRGCRPGPGTRRAGALRCISRDRPSRRRRRIWPPACRPRAPARGPSSPQTIRMPFPPPPAEALTMHRVADGSGRGPHLRRGPWDWTVIPGTIGIPAFSIVCRARILSPTSSSAPECGPMKTMPSLLAEPGESRRFPRETRSRGGWLRRRSLWPPAMIRLHVEVALGGRERSDRDGFVGQLDVEARPIRLGIDGHRRDAHLPAGPDHPDRDLPAVGDQDLLLRSRYDPGRGSSRRRSGLIGPLRFLFSRKAAMPSWPSAARPGARRSSRAV